MLLLVSFAAFGQPDPYSNPPNTTAPVGFYPFGSYSTDGIESINNVTGNVTLSIPLAQLPPGRGGSSFKLNVYYNSSIFDIQESIVNSNQLQLQYIQSNAGGWRYGYMYEVGWDARPAPVSGSLAPTCGEQYYIYKAYVLFPDGSRHDLRLEGYSDYNDPILNSGDSYYPISPAGTVASGVPGSCSLTPPSVVSTTRLVYVTVDGTYVRLVTNPTAQTWTMYLPNGTQVNGVFQQNGTQTNGSSKSMSLPIYPSASGTVETITDRNGNNVQIKNSCPSGGACQRIITDDLTATYPSRQIVITYGSLTGGSADTISWPGAPQSGSQTTLTATVNYSPIVLPSNLYYCIAGGSTKTCNTNAITLSGVTSIILPRATSGAPQLSYSFGYTCPSCLINWGSIHTVTMPSGASIAYSYWFEGYGTSGYQDDRSAGNLMNPIKQKTVSYSPAVGDSSAYTYTTLYSGDGASIPSSTGITYPDG